MEKYSSQSYSEWYYLIEKYISNKVDKWVNMWYTIISLENISYSRTLVDYYKSEFS